MYLTINGTRFSSKSIKRSGDSSGENAADKDCGSACFIFVL
jgi:hypothetical protein